MAQPSHHPAAGELTSSFLLAQQLEQTTGQLGALSPASAAGEPRGMLDVCPEALKHVCSALYGMADAIETGRTDVVARHHQELSALRTGLRDGLRELGEAKQRTEAQVGQHIEELQALGELPPDPALVAQVRGVTAAMQDATSRLGGCLNALAQRVESATQRIAALEAQLSPPVKPSFRDPDTRLYTRAAFDERLCFAVATGPFRGPWCLLLADIDLLAEIGEGLGRIVADALVFKVSRILEERTREECRHACLARYDGGSFAAIVPGDLGQARSLAQAFCEGVAAARWEYRGQERQEVLETTLSIGLVPYRQGCQPDALIERAERALRQAKEQGGNRMVAAADG